MNFEINTNTKTIKLKETITIRDLLEAVDSLGLEYDWEIVIDPIVIKTSPDYGRLPEVPAPWTNPWINPNTQPWTYPSTGMPTVPTVYYTI